MEDIARMAGVSKATVSLALNGNPRISDKTRKKIEQLAAQYGYEPNPAARAMNQNRHRQEAFRILGTLAMLTSSTHSRVKNPSPEVDAWNQKLMDCCLRRGYRMNQFVVGSSGKEQAALDRILKARGIRGVFIHGNSAEVRNWKIEWDWFAAVTFSGSPHEHFIHNVMSSAHQDLFEAVQRLKGRGYKRPGFFISERDFDHWRIGLQAALNLLRKSDRALHICGDRLSKDEIFRELEKWMSKYEPDIIISRYDEVPADFLAKMGWAVPKDISCFSLDVWPDKMHLSGLIQLRETAYKTAVELLHSMLSLHEYGPPDHPVNLEIPSVWHEGTTLSLNG